MKEFPFLVSVVCFSLAMISPLLSITPPPQSNAGIIDKQIQEEHQVETLSPTKDIPVLDVDIPDKTFSVPDGAMVYIRSFEFEGNTILSQAQLQQIAAPYTERKLFGSDIKELCRLIQNTYAEKGYILTRVFPPVQDIRDATLKIEIIEGTLGEVEIRGNKHYSTSFIRKYFSSQIGEIVNYNSILRSLLLLNEFDDLSVGAVFKKGKEKGSADLVIVAKDKLPVHIYADYNTYGSNLTTLGRTGLRVNAGNLITSGDKLSVLEVVGYPVDHLNFTNAIYSIPLTHNGMHMDISYLFSMFKVNRYNSYDLHGSSNIAGFRIHQALQRSRRFSTDVRLGFDYKQLLNKQQNITYSYDKLRVLSVGGNLDFIDSFQGRLIADFNFYAGIPNFLGGLHAVDPQCSRYGAGGRFFIGNLDVRRLQRLPYDSLLIFSASMQGTPNKLPISQQIYIGGIDNVRGYRLSTALGDNGYYGTLEYRFPIPYLKDHKIPWTKNRTFKDFFQFTCFSDTGAVFLNGAVSGEPAPTYITSVGVGLRIYNLWRFDISYDSGFPLTQDQKTATAIQYVKVGLRIL